jgi:hypothetical protein
MVDRQQYGVRLTGKWIMFSVVEAGFLRKRLKLIRFWSRKRIPSLI